LFFNRAALHAVYGAAGVSVDNLKSVKGHFVGAVGLVLAASFL
jgi:hypothetical protein